MSESTFYRGVYINKRKRGCYAVQESENPRSATFHKWWFPTRREAKAAIDEAVRQNPNSRLGLLVRVWNLEQED